MEQGAAAVFVGVGPGAACTTREVLGIGVPAGHRDQRRRRGPRRLPCRDRPLRPGRRRRRHAPWWRAGQGDRRRGRRTDDRVAARACRGGAGTRDELGDGGAVADAAARDADQGRDGRARWNGSCSGRPGSPTGPRTCSARCASPWPRSARAPSATCSGSRWSTRRRPRPRASPGSATADVDGLRAAPSRRVHGPARDRRGRADRLRAAERLRVAAGGRRLDPRTGARVGRTIVAGVECAVVGATGRTLGNAVGTVVGCTSVAVAAGRPDVDVRGQANVPRNHLRVRHAGGAEGPLRRRSVARPGTSPSRSIAPPRSGRAPTSRSPAAPGYSDIPTSDGYLDYYETAVTDSYDMVYLDQRGIGLSGPIQCTRAAATFYGSTARAQVPAERSAAAAAAETFARDCVAESGVAVADLPFYATRQAVEDLEAVRDYLGVDKLDLYGLSYGTQFVQTYAAAHPDHIATLYVDGPVDLTIDGPAYYVEAARSAEDTLVATLDACTADDTCKTDVAGGDALAAYDAAGRGAVQGTGAVRASRRPRHVRRPGARDHRSRERGLQRHVLLDRSIPPAARHRGGIARRPGAAGATGLRRDRARPRDAGADPVDDYSDALYYAVECQDYAFFPGIADPAARVAAWVAAADAAGVNDTRLATSFYGDLPCLFWPTASTSTARPAPIVDPPYPVFVLTSTTDPATPIANGMRIFGRLSNAWFIQAVGRTPRHLRLGQGVSRRPHHGLAHRSDATGGAGHDLSLGPGRSVRRQRRVIGVRLRERARPGPLDRRPGLQHQRLPRRLRRPNRSPSAATSGAP